MRHLGHGGRVRGSGEDDLGNLFASYFPWKDKTPLTHSRNYKYDANQDGRTGTPESSGISKVKIPKLSAGKRGNDSVRDVGRGILQCRPPTYAQGRKS